MKHFAAILLLLLCGACQNSKPEDQISDEMMNEAKHVIVGDDGKKSIYNYKKYSEPRFEVSYGKGNKTGRTAVGQSEDVERVAALKKLPLAELKTKFKTADSHETCLLIESLAIKGEDALPLLFSLINDERPVSLKFIESVSFNKKESAFTTSLVQEKVSWLNGRNGSELVKIPMTINLYAIYHIQIIVKKKAYGCGIVKRKDLFYGQDNKGGVIKEEVLNLWKMWWRKNKESYGVL